MDSTPFTTMKTTNIKVNMRTQPNDSTCGPTSLHSIYNFYGLHVSLTELIRQVNVCEAGGTLAPMLGLHALEQKFSACIYSYNLNVFDPSWFHPRAISHKKLVSKLTQQLTYKHDIKLRETTLAYIDYIEKGGTVKFKDLTVGLLKKFFEKNIPLIVGLSATYLYQSSREYENTEGLAVYDDLIGEPCGHFVVLCGYDETKRHIVVADPHRENPISHDNYYKVNVSRLINAIMLGIITHDANILVLEPINS